MSIERGGDPAVDDWTECLLLAVAPPRHAARVAHAVDQAEQALLDDAVLGDMARVAASTSAPLVEDDVDALAAALYREFVRWSLSPARNRAPRTTFSLLLVHPDPAAAARLVRQLADTEVLSRLPIVFRTGEVDEPLDESLRPAPPPTTDTGEVTRMVLDAVRHTAGEIEQAPGFSIGQRQLRALAAPPPVPSAAPLPALPALPPTAPAAAVATAPARHAAAQPLPPPTRHAAAESLSPPSRHASSGPLAGPAMAPGASDGPTSRAGAEPDVTPTPAPDGPDPDPWGGADDPGRHPDPGGAPDGDRAGLAARLDPHPGLGRLVRRARDLFTEHRPASTVEVIDELSQVTDGAKALYLIMVSEPVPPPRRERDRRAEVAVEVVRSVLDPTGPWYVRTFTADRHLHPAAPLPPRGRLGKRDLRWKWGEYLELFDCIADIEDAMSRDAASFVRRGVLRPPSTVALFLAGEPPVGGVDMLRRLSELCRVAHVVWLSFAAAAPDPAPQLARCGARFLRDHEDVVVEVTQILAEG